MLHMLCRGWSIGCGFDHESLFLQHAGVPLCTRFTSRRTDLIAGDCYRALDLDARSDADPEQLLASFGGRPPMAQHQAVNDLEPPAFGM